MKVNGLLDFGDLKEVGEIDGRKVYLGKHKVNGKPLLVGIGPRQRFVVNGESKFTKAVKEQFVANW